MVSLLTLDEAANRLKKSKPTLYRWHNTRAHGANFFVKDGGSLMVSEKHLDAWIESRRSK